MKQFIRKVCRSLKEMWRSVMEEIKNPKDPWGTGGGNMPAFFM